MPAAADQRHGRSYRWDELAVVCGLLMTMTFSCREPASSDDGLVPFQAVVDLRSWSADDSTVGLQWNHSPNILSFDALDYAIEVWYGDSLITTHAEPLASTRAVISSLPGVRLYRFDVYLRAIDQPKDFGSGIPASVLWAPASRFVSLAGGQAPIRILNRTHTRRIGLQLFDPDSGGPVLRDGATADGSTIDIFVDAVLPAIRAGEDLGPPFPGASTRFSTMAPIVAETADEPLSFAPAVDSYTLTQVELPLGSLGAGLILFGKTASGHAFRLFLRPDSVGGLMQGSAPDQYIEVEVSYQPSTSLDIAIAHEN